MLYHFFISDINKKSEFKDYFKVYDYISFNGGGVLADQHVRKLLDNPENISNKLDEKLFTKLLNRLFIDTENPHERRQENGNIQKDKRRPLKFFEKTIMFYYFKEKMPVNWFDKNFSIEHIFPNSSDWDGNLDKDRTGNLIPIISSLNSSRGNRSISCYIKTDEGREFFNYIKEIVPFDKYDNIITHNSREKPKIKDNQLFNKVCYNNEMIYNQNFTNCLFKEDE